MYLKINDLHFCIFRRFCFSKIFFDATFKKNAQKVAFAKNICYICIVSLYSYFFLILTDLRKVISKHHEPLHLVARKVEFFKTKDMSKKYDINQILLEVEEKEIFKINEVFLLFDIKETDLSDVDSRLLETACKKQLVKQRNIYYNNLISEQKTFSKEFWNTYLADIYDNKGDFENETVKIEIV